MQYSDTTNKTGIIQREESLCSLGDGGITGNTVLLKQFCGYNNQAFLEVFIEGMSVDKHAKTDDYNYTDYPDAPITLVLGQSDYTLPVSVLGGNVASFLRLGGVYFFENGHRTYLTELQDDAQKTTIAGVPSSFYINGKSLFFNCPVSADALSRFGSVHVEFQRSPVAFVFDDTTVIPGLMEVYHDLIPLKASSLYLMPINPTLAIAYEQRFYSRLAKYKRDLVLMNGVTENVITSETVNAV